MTNRHPERTYKYDDAEQAYRAARRSIGRARRNGQQTLHLESLGLKKVPKEIQELTSLRRLYLGQNRLTTFPSEILALRNLMVLDLTSNYISRLSSKMSLLMELRHFGIANNRLENLPSEIGRLSSLVSIEIAGNPIVDTLPGPIGADPAADVKNILAFARGESWSASDAPDAPIIDFSDPAVRKMIKLAKRRGYVTYEGLNAVLTSEEVTSQQIEDLLAMLNEMGINVVESEGEISEPPKSPSHPVPADGPAARFAVKKGKITLSPPTAWEGLTDRAASYFNAARQIAERLKQQLADRQSEPEIKRAVDTLLLVLGDDVANLQPDALRLASRTISAKARAYGHLQAEWELLPNAVSDLFELADVLRDLQAFARTELEAHERAIQQLDLTPARSDAARDGLNTIAELAAALPEAVSTDAAAILEAGRAAHENADEPEVNVAIAGDRLLLAENFGRAIAVALADRDRRNKQATQQELSSARQETASGTKVRIQTHREDDEHNFRERLIVITERTFEVVERDGPSKWGKAVVESIEKLIRHAPEAIGGSVGILTLGAYVAPWLGSLAAIGGSAGLIASWIGYRVWRRTKATSGQ